MNKIIWNDIESTDIKGLMICELPPITKPKMRVQETEIDGVDGSIIEELGYESYDKTIKIGLTKGFDIDEVIEYFNGEGNVVFSNEPEKYYKARIIDQIDYERLLKFRTATVKFRVQPFKYEYEEREQKMKTGSAEGTEIKITDAKATEIKIDGKSVQEIRSGYNILPNNGTSTTINGITFTVNEDKSITMNGTATDNANFPIFGTGWNITDEQITLATGTYFTIGTGTNNAIVYCRDGINNVNVATQLNNVITTNELALITYAFVQVPSGKTVSNETICPMIVKGEYTKDTLPKYEQYGVSPSPDYPSEIENVGTYNEETGKYEIGVKTVGKNLFDEEYARVISNYTTNDAIGSGWKAMTIELKPNTEYRYTLFADKVPTDGGYNLQMYLYEDTTNVLTYINNHAMETTINKKSKTFTTGASGKLYLAHLYANTDRLNTLFDNIDIQIEEGNIETEYEEYKSNITVLSLNEPLRSLPNGVEDIAYIKNNKLYVDRHIGSVVFNGSESWAINSNAEYTRFLININNSIKGTTRNPITSSHFKYISSGNVVGGGFQYNYNIYLYPNTNITNIEEFKTWLSNNNVQVDYELATPITEEVGDITILELVDGETNISNSADANMVIDYVDNKMIINNLGNHTSKPIFEIEGAGTIKFILNGYAVFNYTFDDDGKVVIDSEKQDAYLGNVLKNRNMTGEFPILNKGKNTITWEGLVKNIKATKKSRWL